ncbi:hypothetical protein [Paenibacillus chitinolyticus]|uniref:hypothetical protein n=1 Tax=Paenibacillus chitinolyticus TaxID=79263 RepID=UPI00366A5180
MISTWLNNKKLNISFVEHRNYKFLVYTSSVGTHRVVLVEEVQSGAREFPTDHPRIDSAADMDNFVQEIMDKIIKENFSKDV